MQILIQWLGDGGLQTARRLQTSLPEIVTGLEVCVPSLPADRWHTSDGGHCAVALVVTQEDLTNPRLQVALSRLASTIATPFVVDLSGANLPLASHICRVSEHGDGVVEFLKRLAELSSADGKSAGYVDHSPLSVT